MDLSKNILFAQAVTLSTDQPEDFLTMMSLHLEWFELKLLCCFLFVCLSFLFFFFFFSRLSWYCWVNFFYFVSRFQHCFLYVHLFIDAIFYTPCHFGFFFTEPCFVFASRGYSFEGALRFFYFCFYYWFHLHRSVSSVLFVSLWHFWVLFACPSITLAFSVIIRRAFIVHNQLYLLKVDTFTSIEPESVYYSFSKKILNQSTSFL